MIEFKKFYIKDGLQEELTQALEETHDIPLHPALKLRVAPLERPLGRFTPLWKIQREIEDATRASWFRLLSQYALTPIPTEDDEAIEFFNIENKTLEQLNCLKTIRHKFYEFLVQIKKVLSKSINAKNAVDTYLELMIEVIKHKHMITNEHYGFSGWFKTFILETIQTMYISGLVPSFIVLCEFCPDFVCDDCYPMFNRFSASYKYSLNLVLKNEFMSKIFIKHIDKWHRYILTQN